MTKFNLEIPTNRNIFASFFLQIGFFPISAATKKKTRMNKVLTLWDTFKQIYQLTKSDPS